MTFPLMKEMFIMVEPNSIFTHRHTYKKSIWNWLKIDTSAYSGIAWVYNCVLHTECTSYADTCWKIRHLLHLEGFNPLWNGNPSNRGKNGDK